MDNGVITSFTNDLKGFKKSFATYVKKCNKVSSEVAELIADRDRYKDMSVEDFYLEDKINYLRNNPQLATGGVFVERYERERILQDEPFEKLSDDKKAKYADLLAGLQADHVARFNEAAVKKAEAELEILKAELDESIEKMFVSNKQILDMANLSLDALEVEKKQLQVRKNNELRSLDVNDDKAMAEFEEKYKKEAELFNKKVALLSEVSDLVVELSQELEDIKFRNANVKDAFDINFEEDLDVVSILQSRLGDIIAGNNASLEEIEKIENKVTALKTKLEDRKSRNLVVEVNKTAEDEYSLIVRFGGFKLSTDHLVGSSLTEEFIKSTLASRISHLARNTRFTETDIKNKPVVVRVDGYVIGLNDKNKKGEFKLDEVPAIVAGGLNPNINLGNNPGQPNPAGQPDPNQPNPGQPNPGQPDPNQPNPGQPNPAQGGADLDPDDLGTGRGNDRGRDPKAGKVHKVLKARKLLNKRAGNILIGLAGAGLFGCALAGVATSPLVLVAGGGAAVFAGKNVLDDLVTVVKKKAIMHKLKGLATELGGKLEVDEDGALKIVTNLDGDGRDPRPMEAADVENVKRATGVDVQAELDSFVPQNKHYFANKHAISVDAKKYEGFKRCTPDNLEVAFTEYGGLTLQDCYKINNANYDKHKVNPLKAAGNAIGNAFGNLRDKIGSVFEDDDMDLDSDDMGLGDGGQPDPAQPDPIQPDPVQPDPVQPDPIQPDPVQPDASQGGANLDDDDFNPAVAVANLQNDPNLNVDPNLGNPSGPTL